MAHGQVSANEIQVSRVGGEPVARDVSREPVREDRMGLARRVDHSDSLIVERTEKGDVTSVVRGDIRELAILPRIQRTDELHRIARGGYVANDRGGKERDLREDDEESSSSHLRSPIVAVKRPLLSRTACDSAGRLIRMFLAAKWQRCRLALALITSEPANRG